MAGAPRPSRRRWPSTSARASSTIFSAGGRASKGSDLAGRLELQIGRETTNSGSSTVDARLRLKKNFLAKGDTLYLTSEKDVYDQENLGLKIVFKFK